MQYNGHTTNQDIISQITFYSDATLTDYTEERRRQNVNNAYHEVAMIIQSVDGTWSWDDANNTTFPIGTTDLVSGQDDYTLDDEMLEIELVEIKNDDGDWIVLNPIDISEFTTSGISLSDYQTTDGVPSEYDKRGRSLVLYPASDYNSTGGLKIHFKRSAELFVVDDTTKEPGFAITLHDYLPLKASLDYCILYKPDRIPFFEKQLEAMKKKIKNLYNRRSKDKRKGLKVRYVSSR